MNAASLVISEFHPRVKRREQRVRIAVNDNGSGFKSGALWLAIRLGAKYESHRRRYTMSYRAFERLCRVYPRWVRMNAR